jgi:hypothetical protein
MKTTIGAFLIGLVAAAGILCAERLRTAQAVATPAPIYVVYYWRARPGKLDAYTDYIRRTAEPIDEDARKAGAFEEIHTYASMTSPSGTTPDWTHMRVFRLRNMEAAQKLSGALDEATKRVYPDESKRKENTAFAAELRDFVRQEMWTDLR